MHLTRPRISGEGGVPPSWRRAGDPREGDTRLRLRRREITGAAELGADWRGSWGAARQPSAAGALEEVISTVGAERGRSLGLQSSLLRLPHRQYGSGYVGFVFFYV